MRFALLALTIAVSIPAVEAQAEDSFHSSRVRLLVHGKFDLSEDVQLKARFIPAGNLVNGLAPLMFVGVNVKVADWLGIENYAGWHFGADEPFVSLSFNFNVGDVWGWTSTDVQFTSFSGYWFAQVDYKLFDWLHLGAEGEGWGNFEDGSTWSHGGGPNLLLRWGRFGLDLTVHVRDLNDSVKPEFFTRVHLFL